MNRNAWGRTKLDKAREMAGKVYDIVADKKHYLRD